MDSHRWREGVAKHRKDIGRGRGIESSVVCNKDWVVVVVEVHLISHKNGHGPDTGQEGE